MMCRAGQVPDSWRDEMGCRPRRHGGSQHQAGSLKKTALIKTMPALGKPVAWRMSGEQGRGQAWRASKWPAVGDPRAVTYMGGQSADDGAAVSRGCRRLELCLECLADPRSAAGRYR